MATYKLIQDIEAEDHILGPLSLRQFIFALIAVFFFYISFIAYRSAPITLVVLVPPGLFFGFFALPFGRDQPTEVWALAKLRFWFKPRRRVWDQSGVKELVTITVPKRVERVLTNGLDQDQVHSRLRALATTIDSRGWAIKNINVNSYAQPNAMAGIVSDRLVEASAMPQDVPNYEITATDDMLDATNNPIARQFDQMIEASSQQHRQELLNQMNTPGPVSLPAPQGSLHASAPGQSQQPAGPPIDYWFMNQQDATMRANATVQPSAAVANAPLQPYVPAPIESPIRQAQDETPEEAAIAARVKEQHHKENPNSHLHTLQPMDHHKPQPHHQPAPEQAQAAIPAAPDAAIMNLASRNDLNVATLGREADRQKRDQEPPHDEVTISLR